MRIGRWVRPWLPRLLRDKVPAYRDPGAWPAPRVQARRVLLLDAQGNRNRFDFSNTEVNKAPPPGEFVFVPPKGTQVIRP